MLIIELNKLYYQYLEYFTSIAVIKTEFKFRKDFNFDDWHDWLREIKSWAEIFKTRDNEHRTVAKKRTCLEKSINLSQQLANQFQNLIAEEIDIVDLSMGTDNFC